MTRCATLRPASDSGEMTWCTPIRSRIRLCSCERALAQMDGTPASTRLAEARTDDSTDEPMPTTAIFGSAERIMSMAEAWAMSACTTLANLLT